MPNLLASLKNAEPSVRLAIARSWAVDIKNKDQAEAVQLLHAAMLDEHKAEVVWERLSDSQRGVLLTLIGAPGSKMPQMMFERLHGQIRKMGPGSVERDKPYENPASDAEALYYRGLLFEEFEQATVGARPTVYVPPDLVAVLPTHSTSYKNLEDEPLPAEAAGAEFADEFAPRISEIELEEDEEVIPATTTLVDDMTTLLAFLQVMGGELGESGLSEDDRLLLAPHLLDDDPQRLTFLLGVGISANMIGAESKQASPRRAETRRWLESNRSQQLKFLAEAWQNSPVYRDLWHVDGLHPEPTGWPYDPVIARKAIIAFVRDMAPQQDWWSLDEFIGTVKEIDPDFQRPNGDYDSWYIRNDAGDYLHGFESWDAVEGSLLEFYVNGPMHWLGLMDLATDAARLTAFGRAFVQEQPWPSGADQNETISVQPDGSLQCSRRVSRFDRFQAMRFTEWISADERSGYVYKLTGDGIRHAAEQGINTSHIEAFLSRMFDDGKLPAQITKLLETWQSAPATTVSLEQLLVLRTTAPETLDFIYDNPALRRYLGAKLGPMAAIVRADQWQALKDALDERGIRVEM